MSLADFYRTVVLDHNRSPRRRGRLAAPSLTAEGINALCGDRLLLDLEIADGRLIDFRFEGEASALTLAATSIMGDLICGRSVGEVEILIDAAFALLTQGGAEDPRLGEFNAFVGILAYPNRIKTASLPWATLAGALHGRSRTSTDIDIRGAEAPGQGKTQHD
jgi:nitrogen fixation NifU-like protein